MLKVTQAVSIETEQYIFTKHHTGAWQWVSKPDGIFRGSFGKEHAVVELLNSIAQEKLNVH